MKTYFSHTRNYGTELEVNFTHRVNGKHFTSYFQRLTESIEAAHNLNSLVAITDSNRELLAEAGITAEDLAHEYEVALAEHFDGVDFDELKAALLKSGGILLS